MENKIIKSDISIFEIPKNSDFKKIVSRKSVLLFRAIWPLGCCSEDRYKRVAGYAHSFSPIYLESDIFYDFNELAKEKEKLLKLYSKDKKIFLRLAKKCEKEGKKLIEFSKSIRKKDISKLSTKQLIKLFDFYYKKILDFDVFLVIPHSIQKYLEDSIDSKLKTLNLPPDKLREYHDSLCSPIKNNIGFFEQKNILEIAIVYKKNGLTKNIKSRIRQHSLDFGQIGCKCGIGNIWTEEDIEKRVVFLSKSLPEKRLADLLRYDEQIREKVKDDLNNLNASKDFRELVRIARTYVYLRTFRMDVMSGSFGNMLQLITEIGKRNKLTKEDILNCFPDEIIKDKLPSKRELKSRKDVVLKGLNGVIYYVYGKEGAGVIKYLLDYFKEKEDLKSAKIIKGTIASKGRIAGKAKILKDNSDLGKVEEGDIIIASMTTPDFVPAMEKAAAFVTDEGGILCHAAIVSREMNKPCIIGTKIATKIFKDGDYVEVDANKGIVKILKRY